MTVCDVCLVFLTVCALAATSAVWEEASTRSKLSRYYLARNLERDRREAEKKGKG